MKFRIKLDIENKILIPFMLLAILPITILGIVSYWNGYQVLFNDRVHTQEMLLRETMQQIMLLDQQVQEGQLTIEEAKSKAAEDLQRLGRSNMAVFHQQGYVMKTSAFFTDLVRERVAHSESGRAEDKKMHFVFERYPSWGWTVIYGIEKAYFPDELIEIQKYTLLITIIFLVLSMQSIIFIAHHISKPIKYFAEVCKRIEQGNLKEKVNLQRWDEIGVLSKSFDHMIDQINSSTEQLIAMTKFNEDILKNIDIGILSTDNSGKLLSINRKGKETLKRYGDGGILEELMEQMANTINHQHKISKILSGHSAVAKTIYLDVSTSLLKKEDGTTYGAICSFHDITERKVMENNLVRVDRLASVGQFAAGLAHEIRNPLTGLKTGLQVIRNRELQRGESFSVELLDGLTDEIDRINNLVSDLLDFSRPKQTVRQKTEIRSILQKALDMAKEGIKEKQILVEVDIQQNLPYSDVDQSQAEQIFLNIITNAVESLTSGGHLRIQARTAEQGQIRMIEIRFVDDGCGIEEAIKDKLFDPFFTTKAKGTGLGLVVVAKLVEENGGKIELESKLSCGTRVNICLPEYVEGKDDC